MSPPRDRPDGVRGTRLGDSDPGGVRSFECRQRGSAGELHLRSRLRDVLLDRLEGEQRSAELDPDPSVLDSQIYATLQCPDDLHRPEQGATETQLLDHIGVELYGLNRSRERGA